MGDGLISQSATGQRVSEIALGLRIDRLNFQGFLVMGDGPPGPSTAGQHDSEVVVGDRVFLRCSPTCASTKSRYQSTRCACRQAVPINPATTECRDDRDTPNDDRAMRPAVTSRDAPG